MLVLLMGGNYEGVIHIQTHRLIRAVYEVLC
jgi:hypothetical protein